MKNYCTKCNLHTGDIDIKLNDIGICNICLGDGYLESKRNYNKAVCIAYEFKDYIEKKGNDNGIDALLMLSGGKDSMYMLYQLCCVEKKNVVAYTFKNDYESDMAEINIKKIIKATSSKHTYYQPDTISYNEIMRYAFMEKHDVNHAKYINAKFPCYLCTTYMQICALLFAFQNKIPYVLFCADPFQILTLECDSKAVILDFIDACGPELLNKIPEIDGIYEMLNLSSNEDIPKIVFPYILMENYNPEKIMDFLKRKGLYECKQRQTHCKLHALLDLYSIKKYDTYYYSREMSSEVRIGNKSREDVICLLESYNKLFLRTIKSKGEDKKTEKKMLEILYKIYEDYEVANYEYNEILKMDEIAETLNIDINRVGE